ncbi:MAG: SusC/RagA family TonB-linked outer membrane protein [Flavobacterium sp.]|nr:SusC/RagA family TonB-linked outer membrane protein [Pedobacter sp.]
MKKLLQSLFLLLFVASQAMAQERTVTGKVTDREDRLPLPGVTVVISGSTTGTQTNVDGNYSLTVPSGSSLTFTYIGYASQTLAIPANNVLNVSLASDTRQLGEVVITGALGIKRQSKELGYAAKNVTAKELTQANVTNIANGLTAKVSGLQVNTTNNGVDPSTRIILRGNRSINNNNGALIVLDGVPVPSGTLNALNPNDIQDVNVLKGASAAALYGSEASNGALVITTKRGTGDGKPVIKYSNAFQAQTVAYFPDFQNRFGLYGGEGGSDQDPLTGFSRYVPYENQNYGPAFNGEMVPLGAPLENGEQLMVPYAALSKDPRKSFFNTGLTEQNDFSFQQGDADNSFFLSYQNVYTEGVVERDRNKRNALRVSAARKFGIFKADFSLGYTNNDVSTYGTSFDGSQLFTNVIQTAANIDLDQFRDPEGKYGNPSDFYSAYHVNPWWQIDNSRVSQKRDVLLGNVNLNLKPTDWFDVTYRLSNNYGVYQRRDQKKQVNFTQYAIDDPLGAGNVPSGYPSGGINGQVNDYTQFGDGGTGYSRFQQDLLLNFNKTFFTNFKTNLLLGSTLWQQKYKYVSAGSNNLLIPEYYNINAIGGTVNANQGEAVIRQLGVYGSINIGYKGFAFLEVTGRNDIDTRLSKANRSFFYPSAKVSFVPTEAFESLKGNRILTFSKIRAAYSKVGQVGVDPYSINNTFFVPGGFPYGATGGLLQSNQLNNPTLAPEQVKELEFGTELGFLDSRINFEATYYKQNATNQTLGVQLSPSTGYTSAVINAGEIENRGWEFDLRLNALQKSKNIIGLDIGGNLGIYNSEVVSLIPGVADQFQISGASSNIFAIVGQPYPVIKGTDLLRDPQGNVIVNALTGEPIVNPTQKNFGRSTPKYILGLNTAISYKFITLSAVGEYRGGSKIFNSIGSTLNFGGISSTSALAGRQRFIFPNSVIETAPGVFTPNTSVSIRDGNYRFWQSSAYNRVNSPFISSAAFWKVREVNLNFDLSQFVRNNRYIKGMSFALTGRNLLLFKPKNNPWADPEYNLDNSNAVGQTSAVQTPPTRLFGANLQLTF